MANEQVKQDMLEYLNRECTGDVSSEEKVEKIFDAYRYGYELLSPDKQQLQWDDSSDTWSIGSNL